MPPEPVIRVYIIVAPSVHVLFCISATRTITYTTEAPAQPSSYHEQTTGYVLKTYETKVRVGAYLTF